jgi:hypothetical protein
MILASAAAPAEHLDKDGSRDEGSFWGLCAAEGVDIMSLTSRISIAATAAIVLSLIALPATPALASGQSCIDRNPGTEICVYVGGSGLHINYVKGWARNNYSYTITGLHIELEGPPGLIKNCASFSLRSGTNSANCEWSPNKNVTSGRYCATLWQSNGNGGYLDLGTPCVDVHS